VLLCTASACFVEAQAKHEALFCMLLRPMICMLLRPLYLLRPVAPVETYCTVSTKLIRLPRILLSRSASQQSALHSSSFAAQCTNNASSLMLPVILSSNLTMLHQLHSMSLPLPTGIQPSRQLISMFVGTNTSCVSESKFE